jgi:hypothetical protein
MALPENAVIFVEAAEPAGDFRLRITFSDRASRVIDFGPFLRGSRNPMIQTYLAPTRFATFTVRDGDLLWGDYDLCFPVADLYDGNI